MYTQIQKRYLCRWTLVVVCISYSLEILFLISIAASKPRQRVPLDLISFQSYTNDIYKKVCMHTLPYISIIQDFYT